MVALLAVLLALAVIAGVWYGATSRRRLLDAEASVAIRDRGVARMLEAVAEAFVAFDAAGVITSWSANSEQLFGWSRADALGKRMTDTLIPGIHRQAYEDALAALALGSDSAIVDKPLATTARHSDGHEISVEMRIWAGEQGGFNAFVRVVAASAPEEHAVLDSRPIITLTDPLTSLGNRQLLEKDLAVYEGQVARYGLRSCIALIDIDDFTRYNERYGRDKGDEVIVAIADRLASRSRSGDSVYRVGGDEFICLLPEQTLETGAIAVERMCRSVAELAIPDEDSPTGLLTVSTGLALLDAEHLKATAELMKDAEAALHRTRYPDGDVNEGK
jgi:diguanylate cyclase (GGDEF)-like protein/PAS domain S-box-containing protein